MSKIARPHISLNEPEGYQGSSIFTQIKTFQKNRPSHIRHIVGIIFLKRFELWKKGTLRHPPGSLYQPQPCRIVTYE